jgi:hypothetical protein
VTKQRLDPKDPPPSLEEQYECATSTMDLGLPRGDSGGAQGILAAAAWTEVHLGSALRRLRAQWESARPKKKIPRSVEVLRAAGFTREQARRQHNREKVTFALAFYEEKKALRQRIPEYQQVLDQLTVQAARLGLESADSKATAVLNRWLDDPQARAEFGSDGEALLKHLADCLSRARAQLRLGMRGRTNHHPEAE